VTRQQRLTALADAGHQGRVAAKCPPTLRGARGGCGTDGHMPFDRATRTIRSISFGLLVAGDGVLGSKSRARQDEATGMSHIGTPSHGATRLPALKVVVVGSRLVRIPTPDVIGDRINIFTGRPRRMAPSILRAEDWPTVSRSSFLGQPLGV